MAPKYSFFRPESALSQNSDWHEFMHHSLENAAISEVYRQNAVQSGDLELAQLFDLIKDQNYLNVHKAREILLDGDSDQTVS